jgi:hypothetical protein
LILNDVAVHNLKNLRFFGRGWEKLLGLSVSHYETRKNLHRKG